MHTTETTKHANTCGFFAASSRVRTNDHAPYAGSSKFRSSSNSYASRPAIGTQRTNLSCKTRNTGRLEAHAYNVRNAHDARQDITEAQQRVCATRAKHPFHVNNVFDAHCADPIGPATSTTTSQALHL